MGAREIGQYLTHLIERGYDIRTATFFHFLKSSFFSGFFKRAHPPPG